MNQNYNDLSYIFQNGRENTNGKINDKIKLKKKGNIN